MKRIMSIIGICGLALIMSFGLLFNHASASAITDDSIQENELNAASKYVEETLSFQLNKTVPGSLHYSDVYGYTGNIPLLRIQYFSTYKLATYGGTVHCEGTCPIFE